MKYIRHASIAALAFILCSGWTAFVSAAQVEHHGFTIESEGSARDCLSCHDGALAKSVSYCTVQCDFSGAHSILRPYPPKSNSEHYASIKSVKAKGVKIRNKKITCISCHDLKNPKKYHLVVADQPRLCIVCHV